MVMRAMEELLQRGSMEDKGRDSTGSRTHRGRRHWLKPLSDRRHGIAAARANTGAAEFSGHVLDANVLSEVAAADTVGQAVVNWMRSRLKTVVFMATTTEPELAWPCCWQENDEISCHPGRYAKRIWRERYCRSPLPPHETTRTLHATPGPGDRYLNRTLGLPPLRGSAEVATAQCG
jgi:hypothetical protein